MAVPGTNEGNHDQNLALQVHDHNRKLKLKGEMKMNNVHEIERPGHVAKHESEPSIAATSKETADTKKNNTGRFHEYQGTRIAMAEIGMNVAAFATKYRGDQYIVLSRTLDKIVRTSLIRTFLRRPIEKDLKTMTLTFEDVADIVRRSREVKA